METREETSILPASAGSTWSVGATLSSLLALTSDAVLVFDGTGTILLANDEAVTLLGTASLADAGLVGADVRLLFPPAVGVAPHTPFSLDSLPLQTDGRPTRLVRNDQRGRTVALQVRCERVAAATGETYLLVAHAEESLAAESREHERLVEELSRANRRLAGTLEIVLGTLDSLDVRTLFDRVLEELCTTMDATGSAVYLAARKGFHLQGTSASLKGQKVPRFLPANRSLVALATQADRALRLRVLQPDAQSLRKGSLLHRQVMDEQTRQTYRVRASQVPPFTSFLAVPVRFGGQVIALIEVGWRNARMLPVDDANLLDAVARYLSVQLVGAFEALNAQRREELAARANELRDTLVAEPLSELTSQLVADVVARDLDCACATVSTSIALEDHVVVNLPLSHEELVVPAALVDAADAVTPIAADSALGMWLAEQGEPCQGALLNGGDTEEVHVRLLVLRDADAEPLDELELGYLRRVAETIRAVAHGEQDRTREHRISQALQSGIRSELQQVAGISTQAIYSSATKSASVGGDFYDLISLPERRACVIMGDVSGKGIEAASVSAAVRTALGAYAWEGLEPSRMVSLLNDFLMGFSGLETFATLFVGIIDLAAASLAYCSAGHPPALVLREQTGELEWLGVQSGVVGAFHEMNYRDGHAQLSSGDMLVLYTDGTTEARSPDGRFFGEEGVRDVVMREREEGFDGLLDRLLAAVDDFTGNSLDDDLAMVALRFDEVGA